MHVASPYHDPPHSYFVDPFPDLFLESSPLLPSIICSVPPPHVYRGGPQQPTIELPTLSSAPTPTIDETHHRYPL